jgi:hypothetical protein
MQKKIWHDIKKLQKKKTIFTMKFQIIKNNEITPLQITNTKYLKLCSH